MLEQQNHRKVVRSRTSRKVRHIFTFKQECPVEEQQRTQRLYDLSLGDGLWLTWPNRSNIARINGQWPNRALREICTDNKINGQTTRYFSDLIRYSYQVKATIPTSNSSLFLSTNEKAIRRTINRITSTVAPFVKRKTTDNNSLSWGDQFIRLSVDCCKLTSLFSLKNA